MAATAFELKMSFPAEARFAATLRDLAVHAARFAGAHGTDPDRYGAAVERVVLACVHRHRGGGPLAMVLRRSSGPVEFLLECESRFAAASDDASVAIGWTREAGREVCRVTVDAASV